MRKGTLKSAIKPLPLDIISKLIADSIIAIGRQAQAFWDNLTLLNFSFAQVFIDILLVSIIFYYIFVLLKGSRAVNILIGLVIVGFIFALSKALQLITLGWLLDRILTVILVAIPIIFQQELRMALEKLGHTKISLSQKAKKINFFVSNIVEACEFLCSQKIGALIVLQNTVPLKEYIDTGIALNANISKELVENIFLPKSPLHDGAIILNEDKIIAASCVLPHSFKSYGQVLGTRHKAALGLSENTDAKIIVLSEEKGTISYAESGRLERNITPARLQVILTDFLKPSRHHKKKKE